MSQTSQSVKPACPFGHFAKVLTGRTALRFALFPMLVIYFGLLSAQAQSRLTDADIAPPTPPPPPARSVLAPQEAPKKYDVAKDPALNQVVAEEAAKHGIDPLLVHAVIDQESRYNPRARSNKGAGGLMQMMPATARRFGVRNPYDPKESVRGGLQYLAWLLDRYNGNVALALAGYNAGEGNVDNYGGIPPFRETRDYVVQIARKYQRLRDQMASARPRLATQPASEEAAKY